MKKIFYLLLLLSNFLMLHAQTPALIANATYKASGAGASGVPDINFNIPAGKNRVLIISAWTERIHSSFGNNFVANPVGSTVDAPPIASINGINSLALKSFSGGTYYNSINTQTVFLWGIHLVIYQM